MLHGGVDNNQPLGVNENRYLYNGKEYQSRHWAEWTEEDDPAYFAALDWYDYGARFYDPQLGRFHTIDPLAEDYSFQSPYVYAANNPIYFIDLNGENAWHPETDDNGNTTLVADPGDSYSTLVDYLCTIGAEMSSADMSELAAQFPNSILEVNPIPSVNANSIEGLSLTSSSGLFDNLVGKYLVRLNSTKPDTWAQKCGSQGCCSPTLANRVAIATKFVYGENSSEYKKLDRSNIFEGYIGYSMFQNAYKGKPNRINNSKYGKNGIYGYGATDEMINSSIVGALMYSGTGYNETDFTKLQPGAVIGFRAGHVGILISSTIKNGKLTDFTYWDDWGTHVNSKNPKPYTVRIGGNFR